MKHIKYTLINILLLSLMTSCEDLIEIDVPKNEIVSETLFTTDQTATSALIGTYGLLSNYSTGITANLEVVSGLASDELFNHAAITSRVQLSSNNIAADNTILFGIWKGFYRVINNANGILAGLENNDMVSQEAIDQLTGEALFLRALSHFYLVNLFNEVPYITTTNVEANNMVSRDEVSFVYEQITSDLNNAILLLPNDYSFNNGERVRANQSAARALLARLYLYTENWEAAEEQATLVLDQTTLYRLEDNLSDIFLDDPSNNKEAIWQLASLGWLETPGTTFIGDILIPLPFGPISSTAGGTTLSDEMIKLFELEPDDERFNQWVGTAGAYKFVNKYKNGIYNFNPGPPEHVMMLRLAETYLIRAEARVRLGDIPGAQSDLNAIRNRAGLSNTSATTSEEMLDAIAKERQVELFAEGHRWFDLKRTGKASEVLSVIPRKDWQATDVLFPIPAQEIFNNSNLTQNPGY